MGIAFKGFVERRAFHGRRVLPPCSGGDCGRTGHVRSAVRRIPSTHARTRPSPRGTSGGRPRRARRRGGHRRGGWPRDRALRDRPAGARGSTRRSVGPLHIDIPDIPDAIEPAIRVHVDNGATGTVTVGDFVNPSIVRLPEGPDPVSAVPLTECAGVRRGPRIPEGIEEKWLPTLPGPARASRRGPPRPSHDPQPRPKPSTKPPTANCGRRRMSAMGTTGPGVDHLPIQYGVIDGRAVFDSCIDLGPVEGG